MNVERLEAEVSGFREDAGTLRRCGAGDLADAWDRAADRLEKALREWVQEALTLNEAAEESGMSYSHIQHLVADGTIPNAGEPGRPRIRRVDLPRKGSRAEPSVDGPDLAGERLRRGSAT